MKSPFLITTITTLVFWISPSLGLTSIKQDEYIKNYLSLDDKSMPKVLGIHSVNDFKRPRPLFDALELGASSIATVVTGDIDSNTYDLGNLDSLYIQPIMKLLDEINYPLTKHIQTNPEYYYKIHKKGLFKSNPEATLYLFVDLAVTGNSTEAWKRVEEAFKPLKEKSYLSYTNETGDGIIHRPITVIGTGNSPLDYILRSDGSPRRHFFYDAPLAGLTNIDGEPLGFNQGISPIASSGINTGDTPSRRANIHGLRLLRRQVDTAHGFGIRTKYWPIQNSTPKRVKKWLMNSLLNTGIDFISTDDIKTAHELLISLGDRENDNSLDYKFNILKGLFAN